ncbi:MAG: branched-chain amino acid ABC transporter substrate-binding protein [Actinomycetota bacterium]
MKRRNWLMTLAIGSVFALVASACSNNNNGGCATGSSGSSGSTGSTVDCNADQFGCVTVAAGAPIKIGTLLAISGPVKSLGDDSNAGVALAIEYLNGNFDSGPGQLLGHDISLVKEDDGCSADGGQQGGTKLAADPSIVAVIGTTCSSSALGVADKILSDKGILLISPSNTNPSLTEAGTHQPFYLRTAYNDKIQAAIITDFVVQKLQAATAATIHDESPYATALTEVFGTDFAAQNGSITSAESIQSSDTDFKALLTKIAQQRPDVLYYPDFDPACELIAQQAKAISGFADTALIGSDGCLTDTYIKTGGSAVNGTYASGPDLSAFTQGDFYSNQFLPAYKTLVGSLPTAAYHAQAYDAFNMLAAAITKVAVKNADGSLTIPRTALRDAIFATSGFEGITGTITCNQYGDCAGATTVGIYKAPAFPAVDANAKPVFSETKTLQEVSG